jgi:hypothetical protein
MRKNEACPRRVTQQTLFFMPRCSFYLTENLVRANWDKRSLSQAGILGNSLDCILGDAGAEGGAPPLRSA